MVEGARLESELGDAHRVMLKHLVCVIRFNRLRRQNVPQCEPVIVGIRPPVSTPPYTVLTQFNLPLVLLTGRGSPVGRAAQNNPRFPLAVNPARADRPSPRTSFTTGGTLRPPLLRPRLEYYAFHSRSSAVRASRSRHRLGFYPCATGLGRL